MTRWSLLLALLPIVSMASGQQHYDVIIRNGHIIDGTGSPWYSADVGIRDGRIAAIGRLGDAVGQRSFVLKLFIVSCCLIVLLCV
jgi:dihydroorotase/N-acyl-D-amino-acid deacylase